MRWLYRLRLYICSCVLPGMLRIAAPHVALKLDHGLSQGLVLCMEPIAACLALGDRLSWKTNDKYLVRRLTFRLLLQRTAAEKETRFLRPVRPKKLLKNHSP